ncbi:hypothetical protein NC652_012847 [Populus alba x Populus x berolinensis]|nr:hypothetical protein NC652_012847 [Populus alba x Populus x berolinensis]
MSWSKTKEDFLLHGEEDVSIFQLLKMWVPVCFSCEQLPAIKTPAAGVQLRQPTK